MGRRPVEFRKMAVQKLHSRGSRTAEEIAEELGVSCGALYQWSKKYAKSMSMDKADRRPQDWTPAEKLKGVIEFEKLDESKQGEYLRREGLHSDHIASWKKSMEQGLEAVGPGAPPMSRTERAECLEKIRELERDLSRKNSALAETAALLVLKKKADLIWGDAESASK
jgi:transposase